MKKVTILIPCYNEEDTINIFYARVIDIINKMRDYHFELLFVNDGSTDNSLHLIKTLKINDTRVSFVDLSRNFGKEIAMLAGFDFLDSDAAIIIDVDLQDPPELIPKMLHYWEEGYSDVYARRISRKGETFFKKMTSYFFYRMLQKTTNIAIQIDTGDFRLLDRQCIEAFRQIREVQRYTKGLFSWIGYKKKEIPFERAARVAGKSKWNYIKLTNLAIEGFLSFTILPLRIASICGFIISLGAFTFMITIIIQTLFYGNKVEGYPSLISIILFACGIQLVVLGIIGEYLGRIFIETKNRPLYLVNEYNNEKITYINKGLK